jgi:hypothetical protein
MFAGTFMFVTQTESLRDSRQARDEVCNDRTRWRAAAALYELIYGHSNTLKQQTPWPLVHKRTIPTERPPLVGEI